MKKLLIFLGALSLMATTSATVVSCKTTQKHQLFSIPVLTDKIRDQLIVKLKGDSQILEVTNGKIFNEIDFQKVVNMMVQDSLAKSSQNYFQNNLKAQLKLDEENKEIYQKNLEQMGNNLAQNQFYNEYTKKILAKGVSLDEEINLDYYALNPQNLLAKKDTGIDQNSYFIFFENKGDQVWSRWQYTSENSDQYDDEHLPTIPDLQTARFIIVKGNVSDPASKTIDEQAFTDPNQLFWNIKKDNGESDFQDKGEFYSLDGKTALIMDGKAALQYRFQEYFKTKIKSSFYENLLTMTYLESNLFKVNQNRDNNITERDSYLNISSEVANAVQSWNQTDGYKSKMKMVWAFTFKDAQQLTALYNKIAPYLNTDGSFNDSQALTLNNLYQKLETELGAQNASKAGTDPFFNLNGYNGIVKNDGESVVSVDGNFLLNETTKAKIAKAQGPSLLTVDGHGQGFESTIKGQVDWVLVLPLYFIDLLYDATKGYDYGQNTTGFVAANNFSTIYDGYSGYHEAHELDKSKIELINLHQGEIDPQTYYLYVDGAPYSLAEFNILNNTKVQPADLWKSDNPPKPNQGTYEGFQFALKNSFENTVYGNIGINKKVSLGKLPSTPVSPLETIKFNQEDGEWFVTATDPNLVGKVVQCGTLSLSFDSGMKNGVYLDLGNQQKNGKTLGYQVQMGANASDSEGYIRRGTFDYYNQNVSSLDVRNLSTTKKISLLNQLEFIASKEAGITEAAASTIYPLFLKEEDIFFKPLYDQLKKYLIDEGGGNSD